MAPGVKSPKNEWEDTFSALLNDLDHAGEFAVGSAVEIPGMLPILTVQGNRVSFPLKADQAEILRGIASKAPYGKGRETLVDESVRKAWQIEAEQCEFGRSDRWNAVLSSIVSKVSAQMGLSTTQQSNTRANLYKMLLYEPGGHFRKHRDTEKEPGMFGTLVLQLPSKFEGGTLVVEHKNRTKTFDFSSESDNSFFYTAFYADCEHELRPVTSGWRLALIYNLVIPETASFPTAQSLMAQAQILSSLAANWNSNCSQHFKGYILEHRYTETNLRFRNLKGRDKQIADFILGSQGQNGEPLFQACLLLLEKWETGTPEYTGYGYRHTNRFRYDNDEDDEGPHSMGEVHDSGVDEKCWIGQDDAIMDHFNLSFNPEKHLLKQDVDFDEIFEDDGPDREEYEGYMGNYGPTLQYWYYKSAIVFWPQCNSLQVSSMAGFDFITSVLNAATTPMTDRLKLAQMAFKMVKASRHTMSSKLLSGIVQIGNETLVMEALSTISAVKGNDMAKIIAGIPSHFISDSVNEEILGIIKKSVAAKNFGESIALVKYLQHGSVISSSAQRMVIEAALVHKSVFINSASAVALVEIVVSFPDLLTQFVDDIIAHSTDSAISRILQEFCTVPKATEITDVQRLAEHRMKQLGDETRGGPPIFSWRQPHANFPGSQAAAVNNFLRSEATTETFYGFNGIGHACNWSSKYFGGGYGAGTGYSARAEPLGTGKNAYVIVTKTEKAVEDLMVKHKAKTKELDRLKKVFGDIDSNTTALREMPHQHTRKRQEHDQNNIEGPNNKYAKIDHMIDLTGSDGSE